MPTWVRSFTRSTRGPVTGSPRTTIWPCWTPSSPLTHRMSVLLPDPEGPHTTTTSPTPTARSMSRSTCSGPKCLFTPVNRMAVSAGVISLEHDEDIAGIHRLARLHPHLAHHAGAARLELVFHL